MKDALKIKQVNFISIALAMNGTALCIYFIKSSLVASSLISD